MGSVVNAIQALGVEVDFIPPGCTGMVQPVDVGYNKPFKASSANSTAIGCSHRTQANACSQAYRRRGMDFDGGEKHQRSVGEERLEEDRILLVPSPA